MEADHTIICLGDVAVGTLHGHRLRRLRDAPGHKRLIIGNHDLNPLGEIEEDGFDIGVDTTSCAPGCPPLLLTHVPLPKVPIWTVNVHGHDHDRPSPVNGRWKGRHSGQDGDHNM